MTNKTSTEKLLKSMSEFDFEGAIKAIKEGADINGVDENGTPFLNIAIRMIKDLELEAFYKALDVILEFALHPEIDIDKQDSKGFTAAHEAAIASDNITLWRVLVLSGIDLSLKNDNNETARDLYLSEQAKIDYQKQISKIDMLIGPDSSNKSQSVFFVSENIQGVNNRGSISLAVNNGQNFTFKEWKQSQKHLDKEVLYRAVSLAVKRRLAEDVKQIIDSPNFDANYTPLAVGYTSENVTELSMMGSMPVAHLLVYSRNLTAYEILKNNNKMTTRNSRCQTAEDYYKVSMATENLFNAIEKENIQEVKSALQSGANIFMPKYETKLDWVNTEDKQISPVILAAKSQNIDIINAIVTSSNLMLKNVELQTTLKNNKVYQKYLQDNRKYSIKLLNNLKNVKERV